MARPLLLTDELNKTIIICIGNGAFPHVAARYTGVSGRTLRRWLQQGREEPDSLQAKLYREMKKAEVQAEMTAVAMIIQAGKNEDVNHLKWWLERRAPQRWSSVSKEIRKLAEEVHELQKKIEKK